MENIYYRPESLQEALLLLNKPNTIPLAGGTYITPNLRELSNVVDLQNLGLDSIVVKTQKIEVGAATKLQHLYQNKHIPDYFRAAIMQEAPLNIRNSASLGGLLLKCDGSSPTATSLLALDARIILEPNREEFSISSFFALRANFPIGCLITSIIFPYSHSFSYAQVARTPFDRPIVCAALSTWENGRIRLVLGGYGAQPLLVVDGEDVNDISSAARSAYSNAEDEWASADYRSEIAGVLSRRCIAINKSGT